MAELKAAVSRRTVLKGSLTRMKTFIEQEGISDVSVQELEERKQKLAGLWEQFDLTQSTIEALEESGLAESKYDENTVQTVRVAQAEHRDAFETTYFKIMGKFKKLLISQSNPPPPQLPLIQNRNETIARENTIRLPKIDLPIFTGAYDEWCGYRDTFASLIHNNTQISAVQKFHYLRSSLKGKAADVISSFDLSEANYVEAWNLLNARFDNTRWIVQGHIRAIFDLPSVKKENHVELRELADGVLKHLRALAALRRPTNNWDDLIIHILVAKLDPITAKEWETSVNGREMPTVQRLNDF